MAVIEGESVAAEPHDAGVGSSEYMPPAPVALTLVVGALLFALALFANRSRSSADHAAAAATATADAGETTPRASRPADAAFEPRVSSRSRAYVEHKIAAHDIVLFVDAASRNTTWPHFRTLLLTLLAPLRRVSESRVALVDLETTAQGRSILAALQDMAVASLATDSVEPETHQKASGTATLIETPFSRPLTEFLFVRSVLVGDYRRVKQLLLTGALPETLACGASDADAVCAFDAIRVDSHSDAGFIVLGPQQCFQSVCCEESDDGDSQPSAARSAATAVADMDQEAADPLVETRPLDTVDELLRHSGEQRVTASAALLPRVPLAERARSPARRSRLLVCHDMKGGYLSDRLTQGSAEFDAYRFYQWDLVDLFVYFGHHLVCIPPVSWVAAGHRNGTRVLGAVVIEGDRGAALAAQLFQDRSSAELYATKLATIAALYGFDGYLVNVESNVDAACVANVLVFLETLRTALRAANAEAQVIWYASLARTGKRAHQRRLDSPTAPFFRCVDGLFTDYGWTPEDAKFSAAVDLDRRFDVYMGVDVFGRHDTLGGGKLHCDVALRVAWNAGVSAALFAPGWTHECLQHEAFEDFVASEDRFWTAVRSGWKSRSPCFSALGGRDSLYSAFNVGRGQRVWVDGVLQSTVEWSNVLEMDRQPVAALHAGVTVQTRESTLRAAVTHATAFQGGACVSIQGHMGNKDKAYVKLFDVDIELSARHVTEVSYVTAQPINGSVALLVLTVCPGLDRAAHQVILRSDASGTSSKDAAAVALSTVAGASAGKHFYAPVWTREYGADANSSRSSSEQHVWVKKTYRLGGMLWDQKHIVEVGVLCTLKSTHADGARVATRAYHACVGEVCVAGRTSLRGRRVSVGSIAAAPRACVDARVTRFVRLNDDNVRFRVQWSLAESNEHSGRGGGGGDAPVQYVLVYLCDRGSSSTGDGAGLTQPAAGQRVLLGKSFGSSFTVERCPWRRVSCGTEQQHQPLLQLELVSVSWTGTTASDASVCSVYLSEDARDVVVHE